MDVGVIDIQSRKEKRQQELALLTAEANKSIVDPVTGKCRCLSCGHVVRSLRALADHLRKHDGVNSVDYCPSRIVGASSEAYDRYTVARPAAMQLGDFVNVALRTEPRSQTEKKMSRMERVKWRRRLRRMQRGRRIAEVSIDSAPCVM